MQDTKVACLICARNEERYITKTLDVLFQQQHPPSLVVVVDDGSTDATPRILQEYQRKESRLHIIYRKNRGFSALGTFLMAYTYNSGFKYIQQQDYDFVLIIGADTILPPSYIKSLLEKFREDNQLGLISGINPGQPRSKLHAAGAGRMIRAPIFRAMNLLPIIYGWESYEEVFTFACGYKVRNFPEIPFEVQRLGGAGHSRSYYGWGKGMRELGYPFLYTLARVVSNARKGLWKRALFMWRGYTSKTKIPPEIRPVRQYWNQYLRWYFSRLPFYILRIYK
ncbi:MAG: glycosyltransferase family 2 protein [Promethearchaeota archaeon]